MNHFFRQDEVPVAQIQFAAIAIKQVLRNQRHIGLVYRRDNAGRIALLHLAWHCDLRIQSPGKDYFWADPRIPAPRLRQVAARCRQVIRNNPDGIPYALSTPNGCIDERTGEFLAGPTRHGLTCATFVLAVFESVGLKLLDYETWPVGRKVDRQWQEWVICALEALQPAASAQHIAAVRHEAGGIRIRPEDVAAGATLSKHPAKYESVAPRSAAILARLQSSSAR